MPLLENLYKNPYFIYAAPDLIDQLDDGKPTRFIAEKHDNIVEFTLNALKTLGQRARLRFLLK